MCGQMLSVVANEDGSLSLNQKVLSNIHCMQHDDDAIWESEKSGVVHGKTFPPQSFDD